MNRIGRGGRDSGLCRQDLGRLGLINVLTALPVLSAALGRYNAELQASGEPRLAVPRAVAMGSAVIVQRCVIDPVGAVAGLALRVSPVRLGRGIQVG